MTKEFLRNFDIVSNFNNSLLFYVSKSVLGNLRTPCLNKGLTHHIPTLNRRCCYITVDSATTALQNGACTYQCISKQMHDKTPFSHNSFMKSLEFCDNYITLFCLEKKLTFYNIILTLSHAWHITALKVVEITI